MEYILFNQQGEFLGLRGSEPKQEENLIYFEWYDGFNQIIEPTLKDGKIVSGEIVIDIEQLDKEYTKRISELVEKHVQKFIIDGTEIPREVIEERERLKAEYYSLTNKDLKK
jgi:hypothetical protein